MKEMNKELTDKLVNAFPTLYVGVGDEAFRRDPMYYGFSCGEGWFDIIWKFSEDMMTYINSLNLSDKEKAEYRVAQVKEKFGSLRIYLHKYDDHLRELTYAACEASEHTCEKCGDVDAVLRPDIGWIRTLCDNHYFQTKAGVTKPMSKESIKSLYETMKGPDSFEAVKHRFM